MCLALRDTGPGFPGRVGTGVHATPGDSAILGCPVALYGEMWEREKRGSRLLTVHTRTLQPLFGTGDTKTASHPLGTLDVRRTLEL